MEKVNHESKKLTKRKSKPTKTQAKTKGFWLSSLGTFLLITQKISTLELSYKEYDEPIKTEVGDQVIIDVEPPDRGIQFIQSFNAQDSGALHPFKIAIDVSQLEGIKSAYGADGKN